MANARTLEKKVSRERKKKKRDIESQKEASKQDEEDNPTPSKKMKLPAPALIGFQLENSTYEARCDFIAELSECILEDPHPCLFGLRVSETGQDADGDETTKKPSKVKQLLTLAEGTEIDCPGTARMAVISLLAIFQDILPSYRIRLPSAAELSIRVTKEVKKIRDFERALLSHYQFYLKLLESRWNDENGNRRNNVPYSSLATTSMLALCELLKSAHHFNFRSNILTLVIKTMNNRRSEVVSKACHETIVFLFRNDPQGEVSYEATKSITALIKSSSLRVRSELVDSLSSLPLRVHEDEAAAAKLLAKQNAQRKKKKHEDVVQIEEDMNESSGRVDKISQAKYQTDTLHLVTLAYFRILKAVPQKDAVRLLPHALSGLAKFAHLIHFDAVTDTLQVLKELLKHESVKMEASLNCVLTAFIILGGPGKELNVDRKEYLVPLYGQIDPIRRDIAMGAKSTKTLLQCLNSAFFKQREYSTTRIASFFKKIATSCLHSPYPAPMLVFSRMLLRRYHATRLPQLLESECDENKVASGVYLPDVEDPEHANPYATSLWELGLLRFSVVPELKANAEKLAKLAGEDGGTGRGWDAKEGTLDPVRMVNDMKRDEDEGYIGMKIKIKRHPLAVAGEDKSAVRKRVTEVSGEKKKRRNRLQFRFVTPRNSVMRDLMTGVEIGNL